MLYIERFQFFTKQLIIRSVIYNICIVKARSYKHFIKCKASRGRMIDNRLTIPTVLLHLLILFWTCTSKFNQSLINYIILLKQTHLFCTFFRISSIIFWMITYEEIE